MARPPKTPGPGDARSRLLDAALLVFRTKGYTATTVDDLCREAKVSKGAFFHHFENKEAAALAAIAHWNEVTGELFAEAPYWAIDDPRERLIAYLEFRGAIACGELASITCLLGTLVQETYESYPNLREACGLGIDAHASTLIPTIDAAKAEYAPSADWCAEELAQYIQTVLQGSFVLAKASDEVEPIHRAIAHLKRYVELLLPVRKRPASRENPRKPQTRKPGKTKRVAGPRMEKRK